MESYIRKPELRWRVPAALLGALIGAGLLGAPAPSLALYEPSGYQPLPGEPFFLLSDKAYGSRDTAEVRLEIASREFGLAQVQAYGGVDLVLYRVPRPLEFLQQQKSLHRIKVTAQPAEEGLANTLAHLWDRWYQASRQAWRRIFSVNARRGATQAVPDLRTRAGSNGPTAFHHPPQFRPLPGFELVDRFRYPVQDAAPIQPPEAVRLAGSSSEFISPTQGDVMIPLGRRAPGLYLVEAYVGGYHASALLFVSDTVAITKVSSGELLVWAAERTNGAAVADVEVVWTDGAGVLASGRSDGQGVTRLARSAPERSYVFGVDPTGGVFISESFYYDSEIYDTKLYAVTDRPLYRPGDQVFVKIFGREFVSALASKPVVEADVRLAAYDPGGAPVAAQRLKLKQRTGGDTSFRLPENCTAGGYELRFSYRGAEYSAAFRVAEYQKPHFDITLVPDRKDFKVREPIAGLLQLNYTSGRPVKNADLQVTVRAQRLTMVDGEIEYSGQFPVKIESESLRTDGAGHVRFSLPPVEEPSRYLITVLATDGAAYRVKMTKEILIERGQSAFSLRTARQFSAPGETVTFAIAPSGPASTQPVAWEWVRLEDRRRATGVLASTERLDLTFAAGGSYTLQLRDRDGNVVAAAPHWVSGTGLRAPAGNIEIVSSQEQYQPGETAELLITFPVPVEQALLTLERDRVEQATLLQPARDWVEVRRLAPEQWRARVPLTATFAPNITFSVVYVKDGDYVFQNHGLRVAQPRVELTLRTAKATYAPGEVVQVDVTTKAGGKPVSATVAVSVVDEMIYALQPEIAPDIAEFFYHARRNNVRTASSQSFISYDLAASRSRAGDESRFASQRRVKVLERPRRDEVDTAFWQPTLLTGTLGRARFTFTMPDALTRWRITGRAMSAEGLVGQRAASVTSDKPLYVKWTSPNWMRQGDAPVATIAAFNQTAHEQQVALRVSGLGLAREERLALKPGVNFVAQPLAALSRGRHDGMLALALIRDGTQVDGLETRFSTVPQGWRSPRTRVVELSGMQAALALPADARNVRVTLAGTAAAQFGRVIDDLLEYPYGCIEQTASRMIPFALALEALPGGRQNADWLRQQLNGQRLRLAYMAGPKATFTWWGQDMADDPFLTSYAYYADWVAARALGLELPAEHWKRLLDVYSEGGYQLPFAQRALMLSFMQEMGLPVKGLIDGLLGDLEAQRTHWTLSGDERLLPEDCALMSEPGGTSASRYGLALVEHMTRREKQPLSATLERAVARAHAAMQASGSPTAEALLLANGRLAPAEAQRVLGAVSAEMPTLERALALLWIREALTSPAGVRSASLALEPPWQRTTTPSGGVVWIWPAERGAPRSLQLLRAPTTPTTASVQFDSRAPEQQTLPVGLVRRFYRVSKVDGGFALEAHSEGQAFSTTELYLDELTVTPAGPAVRFALLEAPLPPGASIESTTWGLDLRNDRGKMEGMERARHEPTRFGYAVPLDPVAQPLRIRHLVRFAQTGAFVLPRARLYRMYQPSAKAFATGSAPIRLEVR